jgi:hypothetical protein
MACCAATDAAWSAACVSAAAAAAADCDAAAAAVGTGTGTVTVRLPGWAVAATDGSIIATAGDDMYGTAVATGTGTGTGTGKPYAAAPAAAAYGEVGIPIGIARVGTPIVVGMPPYIAAVAVEGPYAVMVV